MILAETEYIKKGKTKETKYIKMNFILEVTQLGRILVFLSLKSIKFNETLGVGASFGELALLEDKPRTATIIWLENTRFSILEKEQFNLIMGKMLRIKFAKDIKFLSKFSFLQNLARITKQKLWFPMEVQTFIRGQVLFFEGDKIENIIFLEKGEFETTK